MPPWQAALAQALASVGDVALGLSPAVPVLLFLWLVDRAARRLPLAGKAALLLAATGGAAVGLGAVLLSPVGPYLTPGAVLRAGAWWDVTGATLVGERLRLGFAGLGPMLTTPVDALPPGAAGFAALALVAAAVCAAATLGGMRLARLPALPLLGATMSAAAAGAVLGIVAVLVLVWTLSLLNFWLIALATIAWQLRRHSPSRV
jgi:hypothetical protein